MSAATPTSSIRWDPPEVTLGTTTSWIPLTTTWPSSSGCASSLYSFPGQQFPCAWDPGYGYWAGGTPRCLPPAATTWWEQNHQGGDGFTVISIRPIVCPEAFTTAVTSVQSGSSTAVMCCPSGYDLQGGEDNFIGGTCLSPVTSGQTLQYIAQSVVSGIDTVVTKTTTLKISTNIEAIAMKGWNVDIPTSTSSTTPSTTPTTAAAAASRAGNGLSTGAKAGIGVGAAMGGLGLLAFAAAFCLLRRRPGAAQYRPVGTAGVGDGPPPVHEAHSGTVHEMAAPHKPHELEQYSPPIGTRGH